MSALDLEQSPPFSAPLRFFLTAPAYGVAAGVLLAVRAETITATRWAPATFAVVHLLALGVMTQVMAGALLQLLPVAVGGAVPKVRWVAPAVHLGLNLGTLLLVAAFLGAGRALYPVAAALLLATLLGYAAVLGVALLRSRAIGPTLPALRAAVLALGVTAGLGFTLAAALGLTWSVPFTALAHVHAAWGLLGFGLCLLLGVSYLVVPMFQLTPAYPVRLARGLPAALLLGLLLWSLGVPLGWAPVAALGGAVLACAAAVFAVQTFRLQAARKRRVRDATFWSWRVGLLCGLLAVGCSGALLSGAAEAARAQLEYLTGVLVLGGAFPAVIAGMLYKIVPFLVWLHLSRRGPGAPLLNQVIPERGQRAQLATHVAAVALLAAGALWLPLAVAGGVLFAVSQAALAVNVVTAVAVFRRGARATAWRRPPPRDSAPLDPGQEHATS